VKCNTMTVKMKPKSVAFPRRSYLAELPEGSDKVRSSHDQRPDITGGTGSTYVTADDHFLTTWLKLSNRDGRSRYSHRLSDDTFGDNGRLSSCTITPHSFILAPQRMVP